MKGIILLIMLFVLINVNSQTIENRCFCWQTHQNIKLDSSFIKGKDWINKLPFINQAIEDILAAKNKFDISILVIAPDGYSDKTEVYRITLMQDSCFFFNYTNKKIDKRHINIEIEEIETLLKENETGRYEYICTNSGTEQVIFICRYENNLFILDSLINSYDQIKGGEQTILQNFMRILKFIKPFVIQTT